MAKRKLSDFEKTQARAAFLVDRNRQFSPVPVSVVVDDWTDDDGKPIVTAQEKKN